MRSITRIGLAAALAAASVAAAAGTAMATATVTPVANPDAYVCNQPAFIGFENFSDGTNLSSGAIGGVQFTTTDGFSWQVGDFGTGFYNGKHPSGGYTSQGMKWAWLGTDQDAGRIDFINGPASVFSLLASAGTPVTLEAYSAGGSLLEATAFSSNNFNTGSMDELRITRASADIAYVIVHDSGNFFLVDSICTNAPGVQSTPEGPPGHANCANLIDDDGDGAVDADDSDCQVAGRMVGNATRAGAKYASIVDCSAATANSRGRPFTVQWSGGGTKTFKATNYLSVTCFDNASFTPAPPPATMAFDTQTGTVQGTLNGAPGYTLEWREEDRGAPSSADATRLKITRDSDASTVLDTGLGTLSQGQNYAMPPS